jgi:hypothetical protein
VEVIHDEDEENFADIAAPAGAILCTISISLATKLGLSWYSDDEGECVEDGKDDKHVFKIIPVYLM